MLFLGLLFVEKELLHVSNEGYPCVQYQNLLEMLMAKVHYLGDII